MTSETLFGEIIGREMTEAEQTKRDLECLDSTLQALRSQLASGVDPAVVRQQLTDEIDDLLK